MSFTGRFENLFKASYMRNHKAVTTKNLRCFPVCGEEHRDNGFCGNEVVVTWTCEGPVPPQEVETYAEFQEAEDAPRYKIGQVVSDAELSDDSERNKDERNKRNLMKGETKEGADPFHGSLHFARESKGWHYGWMAGRGNGSHALHEMRVYLFERISPDSSVCRLVMNSSPFVVTSRKRLRGRKNAKDEAESAEDEDDDEDGSKKRSKKTPQSKTMPLPKKPVIHQQHPQHQPMLMKPNQPQGIPPMGMPPLSSKQLTVPSFASQSNHPEVPRFDNSSSSQIQFAQPPQRRLPSFVGHLSSSGGQPLGPTPPTYLPTPPSHGMGGMQGLQVPSFARGIPQWPFAVSSTPPIYQHASTTPPIYAHPSTTPPIYNLPFNSFGADFPSYAQPQVSDSDVLESLLGPTPPSSFSSLLSMKHQSAPLFMSQQRNDR